MNNMNQKSVNQKGVDIFLIAIIIIISFIAGFIGAFLFNEYKLSNDNMLIKEYYAVENAVLVSPHSLRKKMDANINDFILVDLRSEEEYNISHIKGAINIPAYKDKDTSDYDSIARIVSSFRALKEKYPDKDIIVYCYSTPCMTGRKVGKILAEHGIYVKHLNIGWNEWRYFWQLWNHEHEWNITNVFNYIESVNETNKKNEKSSSNGSSSSSCPINNALGC